MYKAATRREGSVVPLGGAEARALHLDMPFSLLQPLSQIPLAFIDVETTGASAELGDRVIEVGIRQAQGTFKLERIVQLTRIDR